MACQTPMTCAEQGTRVQTGMLEKITGGTWLGGASCPRGPLAARVPGSMEGSRIARAHQGRGEAFPNQNWHERYLFVFMK